jgi:hypothetical protein
LGLKTRVPGFQGPSEEQKIIIWWILYKSENIEHPTSNIQFGMEKTWIRIEGFLLVFCFSLDVGH